MAEQLTKTFQGAAAEETTPQFDPQQYYSTMQQVMQNPQFMTMAERLGNALMQDPAMSTMLDSLANPQQKDQIEERMARIKEDPSLKPILEEIESGGPAAMMRSAINQERFYRPGIGMIKTSCRSWVKQWVLQLQEMQPLLLVILRQMKRMKQEMRMSQLYIIVLVLVMLRV
ncbi:hypothetical protein Gohar_000509 [Gossypium harknessii]|uniref:Uncharacterized protein n=1 Tax=Gossypium harknessii TaxID=34285 RepID=A0A7J9I0X9_9ROSI|nr:hypothetical protein [Gossypium harknessii]